MAKPRGAAPRKGRRSKKNITQGQAHIKSTFNNTIVSITDTTCIHSGCHYASF